MSENKNASAAADFIKDLHKKAEELNAVRRWLWEREEEFKKETDAAFAEEKRLKEELLADLKTLGLKSVKVESGDSFFITPRRSFSIRNEIAMVKWAELNKLVRPDKELIKKKLEILYKSGGLPAFAEVQINESISFKSAKEKEDASEKI